MAGMLMPKAAMDKDKRFSASEYDVRLPWKIRRMKAIPISEPV
jgi:hypothetical protein